MFDKFLPGFLENIFVNAPIGIFTTDLNRVITTANQLAAQLYGLKNGSELIGKTFPDFCRKSPHIMKKLEQVLDGTVNRLNIESQLTDSGRKKTIRLVSTLLRDEKYKPIGLLNMCEDITAETKLSEQLEEYTQNLENMVQEKTKELKAANQQLMHSEKIRILGNLVASVVHEMGNPLCSLEYSMAYIKESVFDAKTNESIDICREEIDRMGRMLKRLKSLYRPVKKKKTSTDISRLLNEILLIVRAYLSNKNIRVKKQLDANLPPLFISADQIKQVAMNIIINAADSMPDGGELTVSTRYENPNILLEFTDTGTGIPKKHQKKIFTPFFTTKLNSNGLGLGLSVSKQIIEEHRGKIWVESKKEGVASFFITLPINTPKKSKNIDKPK